MKNVLFFLFISFLVTISGCASGCSSTTVHTRTSYIDSATNIHHMKNSAVALVGMTPNSRIEGIYCSGFFISSTRIATAHHCVEDRHSRRVELLPGLVVEVPEEGEPEPTIGRTIFIVTHRSFEQWEQAGRPSDPEVFITKVVAADAENDVALLELFDTSQASSEWFAVQRELPRVGSQAFTMAFPRGVPWLLTTGIISLLFEEEGEMRIFHQTDVSPGASGSALIDEYGRVIGVNVAMVGSSYMGVAIPISYILALVEQRDTQLAQIRMDGGTPTNTDTEPDSACDLMCSEGICH